MVTLQDMADALDLKPKKDHKGFAAYGEIKSINPDNTYQVSLNGSDTTVKCARLTGAHVGDVVLVNVLDNGYAVVTGCVGGDTDAGDALDLATEASGDATTALNVAEGVNDHFWYDNTGAHVTEDTQEDYQQDPSSAGGNTLITSQGMAVRKGTKELATMSQDGFDAKTYDDNDNEFVIAHLGYGPGYNADGILADDPYYTLGQRNTSYHVGNYSVVEGVGGYAMAYCSHAEGDGCSISSVSAKGAHSEGYSCNTAGEGGHSEGYDTFAAGRGAHSEGYGCQAFGNGSHAGGYYTLADSDYQTVMGKYNSPDMNDTYALIIGNGTGSSAANRSDAFTVDWDGNVTASGGIDVTGKATLGAINGDSLFAYSYVSMTSTSISANTAGEVTSSASTLRGYYPIAIANVSVVTGVASLRRFYFSTQETGKAVVKIGVQNDGTSAKTISVNAAILWVKIAV